MLARMLRIMLRRCLQGVALRAWKISLSLKGFNNESDYFWGRLSEGTMEVMSDLRDIGIVAVVEYKGAG